MLVLFKNKHIISNMSILNNNNDILLQDKPLFIVNETNNNIKLNEDVNIIFNKFYKTKYKLNNFVNNFNYININNTLAVIIKDNLFNKKITLDNFCQIYHNNLTIDLTDLKFNNLIKLFKLENKFLIQYIIIYYFTNNKLYGIIHYNDNSKKTLVILETYLEVLLYLYKLEIDIKLNPKYSVIITKYPECFFYTKNFLINSYFNFF